MVPHVEVQGASGVMRIGVERARMRMKGIVRSSPFLSVSTG